MAVDRRGRQGLGVTSRTLCRFIDHGEIVAYRFGRVIPIKRADVTGSSRPAKSEPGTLKHLYPDGNRAGRG